MRISQQTSTELHQAMYAEGSKLQNEAEALGDEALLRRARHLQSTATWIQAYYPPNTVLAPYSIVYIKRLLNEEV